MIVRKGTFIFNCGNKGGIPMTLEKCNKCKMIKNCDLYVPMKQMAAELERDLKEEKMFSRRFI
jgi:phosphoribosyl 1,2-cyclic phosphodiesterase